MKVISERTRHLIRQAACKQTLTIPSTTVLCPPVTQLFYWNFIITAVMPVVNALEAFETKPRRKLRNLQNFVHILLRIPEYPDNVT